MHRLISERLVSNMSHRGHLHRATLAVNFGACHAFEVYECRWDRKFNYVGCKQGFI